MKDKTYRKETLANLRALKSEELGVQEQDAREELFWLRFKKNSGQLEKPAELSKGKRKVARILTVQAEQRRQAAKEGTK